MHLKICLPDFPSNPERISQEDKSKIFILSQGRLKFSGLEGYWDMNCTVKKNNNNPADLIIIIIPFSFLFTMAIVFCLVKIFPSKSCHYSSVDILAPHIKITEPSSIIMGPWEDITYTDKYLSPNRMYTV